MPLSENEWAILRQRIQDALGGGVAISAANPLPVTSETALDTGIATGGTINTVIDTTRGWQVDIWADAIVEIVDISTGISYTREIDSNTADTLDFTTHPLPAAAAVVAGDTYSIRRLVNPLSPIAKGLIHNVVGYIADADIFVAAIAPTNTPTLFKIMAGFSAAGILSVTITNAAGGGGTVVQQFQGGVALNIDSLYGFTHLVHAGDTINYRYSVNATIQTLRVVEIPSAI
ncbi:hypothetical protein ES708_01875 [subsurface metagenome]